MALENIVNSFNYKQNGWITQYISSSFFIKYSSVTFDLLFLVTWTCCLLGGQFVGELSRTELLLEEPVQGEEGTVFWKVDLHIVLGWY